MVYIIVNDIEIPLVGAHSPINFSYYLTKHRKMANEGELTLHRIKCNQKINSVNSITISSRNSTMDLSSHIGCYIKQSNDELTINLKFSNIFEIYNDVLKILCDGLIPNSCTYDCYSTSMKCNLSCEYCVVGCFNPRAYYPKSNFYLGKGAISKIKQATIENTKATKRRIRIMGGETLLDIDDLNKTFDFAVEMNDLDFIDDVWIYTNYTINVPKFLEYISAKMLKHSKAITVVPTTDSFNPTKSKRITTQTTSNSLYNNIKKTCEMFKKDDRVKVVSNVMYLDEETTFNTVKQLYDIGISYVQIAYDEFEDRSKIEEEIIPAIKRIYSNMELLGVKRLKPNLGTTMWCHFSVHDDSHEIYRSKHSFFSENEILSYLNDY